MAGLDEVGQIPEELGVVGALIPDSFRLSIELID
jgi:hypothetical protein